MPQRIQRKRTKDWRMPEGAVSVTRPGRFGNPYPVNVYGLDLSLALFAETVRGCWNPTLLDGWPEINATYKLHSAWLERLGYLRGSPLHPPEAIRYHLRGKDLACWCPLPAAGEPD